MGCAGVGVKNKFSVRRNSDSFMSEKAFLAKSNEYYEKLGINKKPAIWEDGMRSSGGERTYEWWYFDVEYTDGTKVVVIFYSKNGFDVRGPAHPTASIEITFPNGKTILKSISEGTGQKIRASKEKCDVKICRSSIKYCDGNYFIHFVEGEVEYTCIMKPKLPMWRPGTGHWYYGEGQKHYFAWFVAMPSAYVSATLRIERETFKLNGNGYHDHNWGNIHMGRLMNHWYWCRANIGDYTIIACDIIAEKKYGYARLPVFMIGKHGNIIADNEEKTAVKRLDTKYHPVTKKFIDNNLTFIQQVSNGEKFKIEFKREQDILTVNMFISTGISKIKKFAAKALKINPSYIRCIGQVKLTTEKEGVKEVFEEKGIWEQMFFGGNKDAIIEQVYKNHGIYGGNMRKIIGLRTLKTAVGSALAIILAGSLGLKYASAAGIITILSVHNTKKTSITLARQRIESTILALVISGSLFLVFGYTPVIFGVYLIIFIPLTVILKITDGIVVSSVLVTHLLVEKSVSPFLIKNELLLMAIGAGIGIILNIYMPKIEGEIKENQRDIEEYMRKILFNMAESLRNQSVHIEEEKLFNDLESKLKEGTERAYRNLNNYIMNEVKYYVQYMEMRTLQYEILKYMRMHFVKFYMNFHQTEMVAAFTEKVALNFGEFNTAQELMAELKGVMKACKVQELPKSREEFENRAMLFQFLNDMEYLLEIKKNFKDKLHGN